MKKIIIITIILFSSLLNYGQIRERLIFKDLKRLNYYGNVKQVQNREYNATLLSDSTYKFTPKWGFVSPHFNLNFNNEGYLTSRIELERNDSIYNTQVKWEFEYDSLSRIKIERRISHIYKTDTISWSYNYIGDTITQISQTGGVLGLVNYSYKQKGEIEQFKEYNHDSTRIDKQVFIYDKKNRIIRKEDYENTCEIRYIRISTYRDTVSRDIFKNINLFLATNWYKVITFAYDKKHNPIKETTSWFISDKTSHDNLKYIYDPYGNWVERRKYNRENKLISLTKREFTYYKKTFGNNMYK